MALAVQRVMPLVMSAMMACVMSGVMTLLHLGLTRDFLSQWMHAYAIAWPIAACGASLLAPVAFRIASRLTDFINKRLSR